MVVEAGPEMAAAKGLETATSTFGSDETPPTETTEVASAIETANETGSVSATETEIGIAIETGTATEIGVATRTGLAGPLLAGTDRHPRATSVAEISHLVSIQRERDMDREMGGLPRLAPPRPTRHSVWRFLAAASDAAGVAGVATGTVGAGGGAIMMTATGPHAAGLKRAAGCVTATIETGGIGSPTQTCGGIGMTVICEIERRSDPRLTAARSRTNIHRQQLRMYLRPPLHHLHLPSAPFRRAIPAYPITLRWARRASHHPRHPEHSRSVRLQLVMVREPKLARQRRATASLSPRDLRPFQLGLGRNNARPASSGSIPTWPVERFQSHPRP